MSVISGTAYWASIVAPNTTYDPKWTIDVCNLSKDTMKQLEADGLEGKIMNKDDDRGDFISIKRNVTKSNGEPNMAPEVKDGQNKTVLNTLIGNGSKVNVLYRAYDWNNKFGEGRGADLVAVQIEELVAYDGDGNEGFKAVDGAYSFDGDSEAPFAVA
jgi:hypothetical protein